MKLFILRHAEAEPQQTSDDQRCLTVQGRKDAFRVLQAAQERMSNIARIWASPYVRAQQTAEIAQIFLNQIPIETFDFLVPDVDPALVYANLNLFREQNLHLPNSGLLVVSHQPLVGSLINQLCGKANGFYPMGTSSLAALQCREVVAPSLADLLWLEQV